jgi:hypothetical protein
MGEIDKDFVQAIIIMLCRVISRESKRIVIMSDLILIVIIIIIIVIVMC